MHPFSTDKCGWVSKNLMLTVHADDVLMFVKKQLCINMFIEFLAEGEENFGLIDEFNVDKCRGIEIQTHSDGSHELKQPYLMQSATQKLKLHAVDTQKLLTPVATPFLHKDLQGHERKRVGIVGQP